MIPLPSLYLFDVRVDGEIFEDCPVIAYSLESALREAIKNTAAAWAEDSSGGKTFKVYEVSSIKLAKIGVSITDDVIANIRLMSLPGDNRNENQNIS